VGNSVCDAWPVRRQNYDDISSLSCMVLITPTHKGMARLCRPEWLVTAMIYLPEVRSPIRALTGPRVYTNNVDRDQRVTTKLNRFLVLLYTVTCIKCSL